MIKYILLLTITLFNTGAIAENNQTKVVESIPQTEDRKDEKLRLMYQVFVYANDLKNAYKTVKVALKRRPHSLYWHYKMVEVATWLGRGADAVNSMNYIYKFTHSPKMREKVLKSALELYQYKVAAPLIKEETIKHPTPENIKNLIFVYNKVGKPEIAAKTLEDLAKNHPNKEDLLREALKVYILLGWSKDAKRVIAKLEKFPKLKVETAREISFFYIPRKKLKKAYKTLLKAWDNNSSNKGYFIQVSDLGWYLKDFAHSAQASKKLIELNSARIVDYERAVNFYGKKDPQFAKMAAFSSFQKYKKPYLLSSYMSLLLSQKEYKKLYKVIKLVESNPKILNNFKKSSNYYLIKAETLKELKRFNEAELAYKRAISLNPNSQELKLALFWFYIDTKNIAKLKKAIFEIEDNLNIDKSLWLPLAMGHYFLNEVDKAIEYIKLIKDEKSSLDIDMTYSYLLQLRGDSVAANKVMQNVFEYLDKKLQQNPKLIKNPEFLSKYLESGINFLNPDRFEELLKRSKKILPKSKYEDLSISWSQKIGAISKSKLLAQKLSNPRPWVDLSITMAESDYAKVQKLLYKYYMVLPPLDSTIAAKESGNISFAQSLIFNAQENNRKNSSIYQLRREFIQEYVSRVNLKSGFDKLGDISNLYLKGDISKYIARGYYLKGAFGVSKNRDKSPNYPNNIPKNDNWIEIGLKKLFDRGSIEGFGGFRSESKDFFYFLLNGKYKFTQNSLLEGSLKKDVKADETTYLRLGGKKDEVSLKATYHYLPSTSVSFFTAWDKYNSQDDKKLGEGFKIRGDLARQIHSGYPDFIVNIFGEYGNFVEFKKENRGVIDNIARKDDLILPQEYLRTGVTLGIGTATKEIFTRVWRGYLEFTPYYDWITNRADFSINTGYGGSLFGQDKLRFDFSYDQSLNGTQDSSYGLNMNYFLLY